LDEERSGRAGDTGAHETLALRVDRLRPFVALPTSSRPERARGGDELLGGLNLPRRHDGQDDVNKAFQSVLDERDAVGSEPLGELAEKFGVALPGGGDLRGALSWGAAVARLDDDERRSLARRAYLYLAVLGGVLGLLVFGSAALYRLLNAALALSFTRETWHDVWHFAVDSSVSGVIAWWSFRLLRADRAALGAATDETYGVIVLVRAADRAAARARVAGLVAGDPDVSVKG
jgi:hypothetical protein